jgi:hypothetical protein
LEKQAHEDSRHHESLLAMLVPFMRKEAPEKEGTKEAAEKEVVEKEAFEKEAAEKEEDDGPISPIRFP